MSPFNEEKRVEEALSGATSIADACRRLGVTPRGANHSRMSLAAEQRGIEFLRPERRQRINRPRTSAFRDLEKVRESIEGARSQKEILDRLGVASAGNNYVSLEHAAMELGLELPAKVRGRKGQREPETRAKRSILWNEQAVRSAVESSSTRGEVLRKLGLTASNTRRLNEAAERYGLTLPNWRDSRFGPEQREKFISEWLVKGDKFRAGQRLKEQLVAFGLKENICEGCGTGPEWNGRSLTLQLDHINGDPKDNRLENLQILCPNCHSQTETFCGRNANT